MASARGSLVRKRGKEAIVADFGILTVTSSGWLWNGDVAFEHSWDDMRCSGEQRHGSEFFIETSAGDTYLFRADARSERKSFVAEALAAAPV
jgi:hypothetical protein